jgi:hypothetical protein
VSQSLHTYNYIQERIVSIPEDMNKNIYNNFVAVTKYGNIPKVFHLSSGQIELSSHNGIL